MSGPALVWLVRHGPIDVEYGVCVGSTDLPLAADENSLSRAKAVTDLVRSADAVYSSDSIRAYDTAQPIAAVINAPLEKTPRLRELDFGAWEMRTWERIEREDPENYARFMTDWRRERAPGGESYGDLATRVGEFWTNIRERHDGGAIVVVGHGGSLRLLAAHILGLSPEEAMYIPYARGHVAFLNLQTGERVWDIDPFNPAWPGDIAHLGEERTAMRRDDRGLLLVYTGNGKGKTTAALGAVFRALGRGRQVGVVQFVKGAWSTGEGIFARGQKRLTWLTMGRGFTWESDDLELDKATAREAWERAKNLIASGENFLVVLDEITYPINFGFLNLQDVAAALRDRPHHVHVIVTGRDAPEAIVSMADLVTEMREIKHPFQSGFAAVPGIDY